MRKEKAIIVSLMVLVCFLVPTVLGGETTVTGTFTATGTLSVSVNDTTPAFGSIEVSASSTVPMKVTNDGDVTADVTQDQAVVDGGNSMTIGTNGSLTIDQYAVMMRPSGGGETDIGQNDNTLIADDLVKDGVGYYNLSVYIAATLSAESHADEQFSADITVAVAT